VCLPVDAEKLSYGVVSFWMVWWVLVEFFYDEVLRGVFESSFDAFCCGEIAAHAKVFFKKWWCWCHSKDERRIKRGVIELLCSALFEVFVKVFEFCLKLGDCFFKCIVWVAFAHTDVECPSGCEGMVCHACCIFDIRIVVEDVGDGVE